MLLNTRESSYTINTKRRNTFRYIYRQSVKSIGEENTIGESVSNRDKPIAKNPNTKLEKAQTLGGMKHASEEKFKDEDDSKKKNNVLQPNSSKVAWTRVRRDMNILYLYIMTARSFIKQFVVW